MEESVLNVNVREGIVICFYFFLEKKNRILVILFVVYKI